MCRQKVELTALPLNPTLTDWLRHNTCWMWTADDVDERLLQYNRYVVVFDERCGYTIQFPSINHTARFAQQLRVCHFKSTKHAMRLRHNASEPCLPKSCWRMRRWRRSRFSWRCRSLSSASCASSSAFSLSSMSYAQTNKTSWRHNCRDVWSTSHSLASVITIAQL